MKKKSIILFTLCIFSSFIYAGIKTNKIPDAFLGIWVYSGSGKMKDEKIICKNKTLTENGEDFILTFNAKNNTYRYSGHEWEEEGKIKSFSQITLTAIKGKSQTKGVYYGEKEVNPNFSFNYFIKQDRLFTEKSAKAEEKGLYHCK